jgi:ethanolaminephosphotransferase
LDSGDKLACRWGNAVASMAQEDDSLKQIHLNKVGRPHIESLNDTLHIKSANIAKFMHDAQNIMSNAASNYDVPRLFLGTALALIVCILSFFTLPAMRPTSDGFYYFLTLTLYAVLMFASSYVEEEHNFWYWVTSGWFFYLFIYNVRNKRTIKWAPYSAIMALAIHRVIRRWNQTGQKFAGADDIVTSGVFHGNNSILLWILIGATYLDVTNRISKHIARNVVGLDNPLYRKVADPQPFDRHLIAGRLVSLPLVGTAFMFKLAFTAKDAPELTYGIATSLMAWVEEMELVGLARMVFAGIALIFVWIIIAEYGRSARRVQYSAEGRGGKLPLHSRWIVQY